MNGDEPPSDAVLEATLERISDGVIGLDPESRVTYLNGYAAAILGVDRADILGTRLWDALAEDRAGNVQSALKRATESGTVQSCAWHESEQDFLVRLFPDDDGVTLLFAETTGQRRHERTLGRLHEATRRMLLAESPEEIADLVSRAGVSILDLPINAVHLYDDETETLAPTAQSPACVEVLGTAPALDSGLAWDAYQSGTVGLSPDLTAEANVFSAETPFQSELYVPLGDHGVFIGAAEEADQFSETDVTLARLLGANATVALDQVTSESRLAQQRDNLELLTRMMSHDIRNDLQVVGAVAEMLADVVEGTQEEYVEKIRRSTAAAVDLTTSAQELVEAMLRTEADPCPVPLRESLLAQIERMSETTSGITVEGTVADVPVVADEMLGSVFRNVLKNAIQHNDSETPTVTVSTEATDDTVRVSIADNGPGVPDSQKENIFGRGERGMSSHGTGIGLYLVHTLLEQYDGRVWVEDNDPRGAVFVIELRRADGQ